MTHTEPELSPPGAFDFTCPCSGAGCDLCESDWAYERSKSLELLDRIVYLYDTQTASNPDVVEAHDEARVLLAEVRRTA